MDKESRELVNTLARRGFFSRFSIRETSRPLEPEITFGRAILDQALIDSFNNTSASEWFRASCSGFRTICFIADLEEEQVIHKKELLSIRLRDAKDKDSFDTFLTIMVE